MSEDEEKKEPEKALSSNADGGAEPSNPRIGGSLKKSDSKQKVRFGETDVTEFEAHTSGLFTSMREWSWRKKVLLFTIAVAQACGFASLWVMVPLFPAAALRKGVSEGLIGLVLGTFPLAAAAGAPFFGYFVPLVGVRALMVSGIATSGGCAIAFGLIEQVSNKEAFAAGSFLIRTIQGFSYAAYVTAAFAVVTMLFRQHMGVILSFLEILVGIGCSSGPPIGSALFSAGGYLMPFAVLGGIMLASAVPLSFTLPKRRDFVGMADLKKKRTRRRKSEGEKPAWHLLLSWEPMLIMLVTLASSIAFTFKNPILQPFLDIQYGLKESRAGYVFLATLGCYCIATPIAGAVCDKYPNCKYVQMSLGHALISFGFLVVGPAPFLHGFLPQKLEVTIAGLVLHGIGLAFAVVPTFQGFTDAVIRAGFPQTFETYSMTSAMYNSAWSFGQAIGCNLGSGMSVALGVRNSFLVASSLSAFAASILLLQYLINALRSTKEQGSQEGKDETSGDDTAFPSKEVKT